MIFVELIAQTIVLQRREAKIMLSSWTARAAGYLAAELNYDSGQQEILQYALTILSTTVFGFVAIILAGFLVGVPGLAFAAALSSGILRIYSGGAHASCPERCVAIGAIIFTTLGMAAGKLAHLNLLYNLFPLVCVFAYLALYFYSPADAPGKPIETNLGRKIMRRRAFVILSVWAAATLILTWRGWAPVELLLASCLGVGWQSFSLTPCGYLVEEGFLDGVLKWIIPIKAES